MAAEELLEHGAEQVRARARERGLVELQRDLHAAAEDDRARLGQAAEHRRQLHRAHALDLAAHRGIGEVAVEVEHLAQRGRALVGIDIGEAQVVEAQVADEAPGQRALGQRRVGPRGPAQDADRAHRRRHAQREVRLQPGGQQQRQVAVGAQRIERDVAQAVRKGRVVLVHQRDVDLAAGVAGARALRARAVRHQPRFAPHREVGAEVAVVGGEGAEEGPELALLGAVAHVADHALDGEDLEVARPRAVDHRMVLVLARPHRDAVAAARHQVHDRRAEQRELARVDQPLEVAVGAVEQDHDLHRVAAHRRGRGPQLVDAEEQVAVREGEVLVQQPVALERARVVGQERLVGLEALVADRLLAQRHDARALPRGAGAAAADGADRVVHRELEHAQRMQLGAREEELEPIERHLGEARAAHGLELDRDRALGLSRDDRQRMQDLGRHRPQAGFGDADRPQRDRVAGAELAGRLLALDHAAAQDRVARQLVAGLQRTLVEVAVDLHHAHGGQRREEVRIDHLEQPLREARELGVHLELDARREEAEALEQPLDIRVADLDAAHAQAARDLRIALRELGTELVHVGEFAVVVVEQPRVHQRPPVGRSIMWPLSRSSSERRMNSIG